MEEFTRPKQSSTELPFMSVEEVCLFDMLLHIRLCQSERELSGDGAICLLTIQMKLCR